MLSAPQQSIAVLAYIKGKLAGDPATKKLLDDTFFLKNLDYNFVTLFAIYTELYGYRNDCLESLVLLVQALAQSWSDRPDHLKAIDQKSLKEPTWYMDNKMLGGMCYVDLYAGNLQGLRSRIPYLKELGLTYLHLMPLFKCPEKNSDGGYAVSSYRDVDPRFGTTEELRIVAKELHEAGICLVIDLVMNHTSNEHEWAQKAAAADPEYSGYYWIFPDRNVPNGFDQTTREIFPDDHRGSFIQLPDGRWIWSSFYHFQWDLNYSNPAVFRTMASEMLFLANVGVDIFRLDAVAFIWKRMGTTCESLPEAHKIIRAYNSICRIAAPSVLFKSEAIVHPAEVVTYIDSYECQLSYNPLEMALSWEALATHKVDLLSQALERWHNLRDSGRCHWVNYVRSHDDIGWTFSDEDAKDLGIDGYSHRRFLNAFYVNRHPGSFARGVPFQDNPTTGDCRISGTAASLAGLESGEWGGIDRLLLLYSIAFSTGGIALLYLGDELGQLNDYSYMQDVDRCKDSRWVHRPKFPEQRFKDAQDPDTQAGQLFSRLKHLITVRKQADELAGGQLVGFHTGNPHVLGYLRFGSKSRILALANFDNNPQWVGRDKFMGLPGTVHDLVGGYEIELRSHGIELRPYQFVWLRYE